MKDFFALSFSDFSDWLHEHGEKAFRAKQVYDWIFRKEAADWDEMTNLSKELREKLKSSFRLMWLTLKDKGDSEEECAYRLILETHDGHTIMPMIWKKSGVYHITLSSQVGSPVRSIFHPEGKMGFIRNLQPSEILSQFLIAQKYIQAKIGRVRFSEMGEPLKNFKNIKFVIEHLCHQEGAGLKPESISLTTVGITDAVKELAKGSYPINLNIELHGSNQLMRQKLIPYAKKYPLDELLTAVKSFTTHFDKGVCFEYALVSGINDHPDQAFELVHLIGHLRCNVRLIPFKVSSQKSIKEFRSVLYGGKVANSIV